MNTPQTFTEAIQIVFTCMIFVVALAYFLMSSVEFLKAVFRPLGKK